MNIASGTSSFLSGFSNQAIPVAQQAGMDNANRPKESGGYQSAVGLKSDGLQIFQRAMSSLDNPSTGLSASPSNVFKIPSAERSFASSEPITAQVASKNILNSIVHRLQQDRQGGATTEQMQSRLEAGKGGFEKGFTQAIQDLKDLGMYTPEVEADVAQTHALVSKGFDALQEQIQSAEPFTLASVFKNAQALDESVAKTSNVTSLYQHDKRDFSFQLTTREGDKVTIRLAQQFENGASRSVSRSQQGTDFSLQRNTSQSSDFQFEVVGSLNGSETRAINELLTQIQSLSTAFFAGNSDAAIQQAQALQYNSNEISAFSLDLQHVQTQQIQSTYETAGYSNQGGLSQTQVGTQDLVDAILAQASTFSAPETLLAQMSELFDRQGNADFSQMIHGVIDFRQV